MIILKTLQHGTDTGRLWSTAASLVRDSELDSSGLLRPELRTKSSDVGCTLHAEDPLLKQAQILVWLTCLPAEGLTGAKSSAEPCSMSKKIPFRPGDFDKDIRKSQRSMKVLLGWDQAQTAVVSSYKTWASDWGWPYSFILQCILSRNWKFMSLPDSYLEILSPERLLGSTVFEHIKSQGWIPHELC